MNTLFWLTLSLIGAAGVYNDALRSYKDVGFLYLFEAWCLDYVPACLLCIVLQLLNRRWPDCFLSARRMVDRYLTGGCLVAISCQLGHRPPGRHRGSE